MRKYPVAKERIAELEGKIEDISKIHGETLRKRDQRIQAVEDELARTKQLLAARSIEVSVARSISSPSNIVSEGEVLGTVRALNENVFQVAADLSEEWQEFSSARADRFPITKEDFDTFSRSYGTILVHQVLQRNPAAVTFLVQSCLCEFAAQYTSSWRHNQELKMLRSICQLLSPSGKHELHVVNGM